LFASPCTGRKPVSIFDCIWSLHPFFFMSTRKCLRFRAHFRSTPRYFCGKLCAQPVEKTVENQTSGLRALVRYLLYVCVSFSALCKTGK
jgi:hypothetical protein